MTTTHITPFAGMLIEEHARSEVTGGVALWQRNPEKTSILCVVHVS